MCACDEAVIEPLWRSLTCGIAGLRRSLRQHEAAQPEGALPSAPSPSAPSPRQPRRR